MEKLTLAERSDGSYILQTTRHPKLKVTEFLNTYPKPGTVTPESAPASVTDDTPDRAHVKVQWDLIQLGRAEGCSVCVPVGDRNLVYRGKPFARDTVDRLPGFGFDENTRRIIQISGLVRGERFEGSELFSFPTSI